MALSVTEILAAVRSRAAVPDTSPEGYTNTDLLNYIRDELESNVYPAIVDMTEEFFIMKISLNFRDENGLPNFSHQIVPLPSRCFGWQLREIKYRDLGGNIYNVPQVGLDDDETATTRSLRASAGGFIPGVHVANDHLKLIQDTTNLTGFLDITYVIKPSTLSTSTTLVADITNITKTSQVSEVAADNYSTKLFYAGQSQASVGNTSIVLTATTSETDQTAFNGLQVVIVSGPGKGQTNFVPSTGNNWNNTTKVLTVANDWTSNGGSAPGATSFYNIMYSLESPNITSISVSLVGADLDSHCADKSTALFDIYKKTTGALIKVDVPMTRNDTTFSTTAFSANEAKEIMDFQQGGFMGTLGTLTISNTSELVLCPAGQNIYTTLPPEADQLLIISVVGRYLESLGDTEGLNVVKAQEVSIKKNLIKILGRRFVGEAKVFANRKGFRRWFQGNRFSGY